jgi:GDPmannose 4,6-dehydratase
LLDITSIYRVISDVNPDEIYNEADQDHVRWSYDMVGYSSEITAASVAKILEIIKQVNPSIRYFQPCTSNMYGISKEQTQNEETRFNPQSPYAISKTFAYYVTRYYREAFGIHACVGILFNHESPRRTPEYVTRKITQSVARIALKKQEKLYLGDLSAEIDWGYSPEYMECAWRMLQAKEGKDYIIASGKVHSVQDFVEEAFKIVDLNYKDYVETDSSLIRPTKTSPLVGDITKAKKELDWEPTTTFKELVTLMVNEDLKNENI